MEHIILTSCCNSQQLLKLHSWHRDLFFSSPSSDVDFVSVLSKCIASFRISFSFTFFGYHRSRSFPRTSRHPSFRPSHSSSFSLFFFFSSLYFSWCSSCKTPQTTFWAEDLPYYYVTSSGTSANAFLATTGSARIRLPQRPALLELCWRAFCYKWRQSLSCEGDVEGRGAMCLSRSLLLCTDSPGIAFYYFTPWDSRHSFVTTETIDVCLWWCYALDFIILYTPGMCVSTIQLVISEMIFFFGSREYVFS